MSIALTFDLEKDANLSSTYGITVGLKKILKILEKYSINSTFFVTSYIAENYSDIIKKLSRNNEIGSHGHIHKKYKKIGELEKERLQKSKFLLEDITGKEVLGFRAPKLYTDIKLYKALKELNFLYDASGKPNSNLDSIFGLRIFKVSFFNVYFRFPFGYHYFKTKFLLQPNSLSVLYFHPWEGIDMRKLYLQQNSVNDFFRIDRWFNTGDVFLKRLENFIKYLKTHRFKFVLLKEML